VSLWLSGRALRQPEQAATLWPRQPLHYDEVIQLPLVGLPEHIAAIARSGNGDACLNALTNAGESLRQQWAVPAAVTLILYDELRRCTTPALIARFHAVIEWLPENLLAEDEQPLFKELCTISSDTAEALTSQTRIAREQQLRRQITRLREQRAIMANSANKRVRGYAETLQIWQQVLEQEVAKVAQEREQIGELPIPYRAGTPLQTGNTAFHGRDDLFGDLENMLVNSPDKITPLLLGQPRTGKTSVLKQLPVKLGSQVLPVYLDMEREATAENAQGLVSDLVEKIRVAAQHHAQPLSLPPLEAEMIGSDPYRVFENWIAEVEQALGAHRWLLLTLDEFDRIDVAVKNGTMDERIFFLLRSLIQHHPRVTLALCGTFTLDECDQRWYEALKSTRMLPVTYLHREDARRFFTHPSADFPAGVYAADAVERVLYLTNGHPLFLHMIGFSVLDAYNESRKELPPGTPAGLPLAASAIDAALPDVFKVGDATLKSLWLWFLRISPAPDSAAALLQAVARGQSIATIGDPAQRAELLDLYCERDVLMHQADGSYAYQVPLIARWIAEQRRLPRLAE